MSSQPVAVDRADEWCLMRDNTPKLKHPWSIRRWVHYTDGTKKLERLPPKQWSHHAHDERELRRFVIRKNGHDPDEDRAKAKYEYRTAFLSPQLLEDYFENHLSTQIPDPKGARAMYSYLEHYCLNFFINKMGLPNPLDWQRQQGRWAKYLLNRPGDKLDDDKRLLAAGDMLSAKVLKQIVAELNRLLKFLHEQRPDEIPGLAFSPLTQAMLKAHEEVRKTIYEVVDTKYIRPAHREKIFDEMQRRDLPWRHSVELAYAYGLRRCESLGQRLGDIRLRHLEVAVQLDYFETEDSESDDETKIVTPHHKPLKDREKRMVPHWVIKPDTTYSLVEKIKKFSIHPDTLTKHFTALTEELFGREGRYIFHDLRRSWITDMLVTQQPEAVRLASGHANISTTYKHYVKDTRELDGDVFIPATAEVIDLNKRSNK